MNGDNLFDPVRPATPPASTTAPRERRPGSVASAQATAPVTPAAAQSHSAPAIRSLTELAEVLRKVNLTFDLFEINASISVEEDEVVVRIVNQRTGELIRQIPSEAARRLAAALEEGRGILTDLQA